MVPPTSTDTPDKTVTTAVPSAAGATPVMAQYLEIKAANADSLLFFRMGDFYELFFEDAAIASKVLGIALTKRGKHGGDDIPMAGVPVHAAQDYLQKLIAAGHKVAVCEQLEGPAEAKKRGSKAVVKRDVTRLITPGTLTEDALLPTGASNWLLALAPEGGGARFGFAWMDLSTGAFFVSDVDGPRLEAELARLAPAETLFPDTLDPESPAREALDRLGGSLSPQPAALFHGSGAGAMVAKAFGVASLDAFGSFSRGEERAAAALVGYVERTQKQAFTSLQPPTQERAGGTMAIDEATRASLDLVRARSGDASTTLLAAMDRCVTSAGTRRLAGQIAAPLTDLASITARHDAIDVFVRDGLARQAVRTALSGGPDLARALSRVQLGRAGPRDLTSIGLVLHQAGTLETVLPTDLPELLDSARQALSNRPSNLAERLAQELIDTPPMLARDGGFIAPGVDSDLDATRALRDDARKVIAGLQATYGEQTDARSLKIKHNGVLGYFIEVPTL